MRQGASGLVHWDDPDGWEGDGDGGEGQHGEHMYTHGCTPMADSYESMAKTTTLCKVISLQLK